MRTFIIRVAVALVTSSSCFVFAADLDEMSLEELLNVKVTVASSQEQTTRTSPAVVTVIMADEIARSGARDLIDILDTIPGFHFGTDTQGTVGLGFRGLWGHEGKILLIVDGLVMNEGMYSTNQFGNRYPVSMIHQIEIIRGPGSAMYGGNAELAVIKIKMKDAEQLKGGIVNLSHSRFAHVYAREGAAFGVGKVGDDWRYNLIGSMGSSILSERDYRDSSGARYNLRDSSGASSTFVDFGASKGNADLRLYFNHYDIDDRSAYGVNLSEPISSEFTTYIGNLKYHLAITPAWTLTPEITVKKDEPWKATAEVAHEIAGVYYYRTFVRQTATLNSKYVVSDTQNWTAGLEHYDDHAVDRTGPNFVDGSSEKRFSNSSAYTEYSHALDVATFTFGARFDKHSHYGSEFVPRFGVVRLDEPWHYKLLVNRAYHAPSIENINAETGGRIRPEKTDMLEIELGRKVSDDLFITTNLFMASIKDPIVYNYSAGDAYYNFASTGSKGVEVEGKWKSPWGLMKLGYSFYKANFSSISFYQNPDDKSAHLGLPTHKASLVADLKLANDLSLNPSLLLYGKRYGYDYDDGVGALAIKTFAPTTLFNIFLEKRRAFSSPFDLGVGFFNLFGSKHEYIQPYAGGHTPLAAGGTEFVLNIKYQGQL